MLVFHLENKMPQLCKEKKLIWLLRTKVIVESQVIKNSFPISGKWILICSWYNHHLSKNQFGNVSYKRKIAGNISILYDTVPYAWIHNTSLSRVWNFLYLSQRTWLFFLLSGALFGVCQAFLLHESQWQNAAQLHLLWGSLFPRSLKGFVKNYEIVIPSRMNMGSSI